MTLQYEFDSWAELHEAMKNLKDYHDCEKCRGKMVCITTDKLGVKRCGYCNQVVRYPRLTKGAFETWARGEEIEQEEHRAHKKRQGYRKSSPRGKNDS